MFSICQTLKENDGASVASKSPIFLFFFVLVCKNITERISILFPFLDIFCNENVYLWTHHYFCNDSSFIFGITVGEAICFRVSSSLLSYMVLFVINQQL